VERAARPLTTRDTVLLISHAAGDRVVGRTVMQKLAYFSGLFLGTALGHHAHYYGPYSSKVEDALNNAVIAGELREIAERMPDWSGGPDLRKYTYDLQPSGRDRVERLVRTHPKEWQRILTAVGAVRTVLPDLDQKTLSSAAKTFLIISESEEGVEEDDIPALARQLGWELSPAQVRTTIRLLDHLGLLDEADETA
jgi:uncharacterized protein YwgA